MLYANDLKSDDMGKVSATANVTATAVLLSCILAIVKGTAILFCVLPVWESLLLWIKQSVFNPLLVEADQKLPCGNLQLIRSCLITIVAANQKLPCGNSYSQSENCIVATVTAIQKLSCGKSCSHQILWQWHTPFFQTQLKTVQIWQSSSVPC